MGLTDNQLEILGDGIASLYQELENEIIRDIARRVKKTGSFTETAELMVKALVDKGANPAVIREKVLKYLRANPDFAREVSKNTLEHKKMVKEAIAKTERIAKLKGDEIIANAGDMAFNYDESLWGQAGQKITKDNAFKSLVDTMSKTTAGTLKDLTKSIGFKGAHSTTKLINAYQHALDMALLKMTSGAFSFDRAAEDCVRELARSGLRSIDYASGRSYQLDTAARMSIRTASSQLAAQITMQHCDDTETDLVEVDQHWGARPEHADWQGKIYSRNGKSKKYPDFAICRYGEADGLCGVNCRHTFYPFFEGISAPNKWEPEPEPKQYRGREYTYTEATQKQRQMERDVRATKREIEATKAMGGDTKLLEAKKRKQINEYHEFSESMGIRAKDNRLRVSTGSSNLINTKSHNKLNRAIGKSQEKFDMIEQYRKGSTHRKTNNGIEIIDEATYNKLIRKVKKNGGIVIRGSKEVEEHLAKNNSTASCIGDVLLFSKSATISDTLEETYHFEQNLRKLNHNKPAKERMLLNEIDAQEYLLSVSKKYNVPESEQAVTRANLEYYRRELKRYYEGNK